MIRVHFHLLLLAAAAAPAFADDDAQRAAMTFFEKEVRPILVNRCYECHGEKKQKGGLRADHIGYLKAGGDTGPALVPGKPEESPLIEAVRYTNADFKMPPKKKLPDAEIAVLEKWIKMGAPWPEDTTKKVRRDRGRLHGGAAEVLVFPAGGEGLAAASGRAIGRAMTLTVSSRRSTRR